MKNCGITLLRGKNETLGQKNFCCFLLCSHPKYLFYLFPKKKLQFLTFPFEPEGGENFIIFFGLGTSAQSRAPNLYLPESQ